MEESARRRLQIAALVVVCVITWYVTLRVRGQPSPSNATFGEHFTGFTAAISVGSFATIAFTKWIWRWRILHPWFVDTPLVAGSWKGKVLREYPSDAELSVIVTIEQPSVSKILFNQTLEDRTRDGYTEACALHRAADGIYYLEGIFLVKDKKRQADMSGKRMYYGAMRHQLDDPIYPTKLTGEYWSTAPTCGRVELSRATTS